MNEKRFHYVYGPVSSWRLGRSLGVDPISHKGKVCTFDCVYCQLGKTDIFQSEREIFVPTEKLLAEIKSFPPMDLDFITFSGTGEPTLAKNLGEMIHEIKKIKKEKIAVITNSSLMDSQDVREDLSRADLVLAKLDASFGDLFHRVSRPVAQIDFNRMVEGIAAFRKICKGELALQMMFITANQHYAAEMAKIADQIRPDEIQINTPLRLSGVAPLQERELRGVTEYFRNYFGDKINIWDVYETRRAVVHPVNEDDTRRRHGESGPASKGEDNEKTG